MCYFRNIASKKEETETGAYGLKIWGEITFCPSFFLLLYVLKAKKVGETGGSPDSWFADGKKREITKVLKKKSSLFLLLLEGGRVV